jgi:predicted O-methyltransferase YrrM
MTLQEIYEDLKAKGFETDKGSIHSYIEVYEEILEPYRETAKYILEIGVFQGNSLRMWNHYFKGTVYGVDCDIKPHGGLADLTDMVESEEFNIKLFDAERPLTARYYFNKTKFDVIIEDAGHHIEQQVKLYNIWKKYLNKGGIYIIEDIQDIDKDRNVFESLDNSKNITILDRRSIKNRYDDVLVIIKDK